MTGPSRAQAISSLNQLPINQVAEKLLPDDWKHPLSLHILSLANWEIAEGGLFPRLEHWVLRLLDMDPVRAMAWVTQTDSGDDRNLELPNDREDAAIMVLDAINSRLQAA